MAEEMTFDAIYRTNGWNGGESRSGPGSSLAATHRTALALGYVLRAIQPESVLDVGCGDGNWLPDLPGYVGTDVSEEAIRLARIKHPDRRYVTEFPDGHFDLAICRDAIQHLSLTAGIALLAQVAASAKWMLVSTYVGTWNASIPDGDFYSPDLTAEPFGLPPAVLYVFDGWDYQAGTEIRDATKFLGLWPGTLDVRTSEPP